MVSPSQLGEHTNQAHLLFCFCFNITPTPTSSLTLQYFCGDKSQSVSYKTLNYCYSFDAYRKWLYWPDYWWVTAPSVQRHTQTKMQFRMCMAANNNQSFKNPQISVVYFSDIIAWTMFAIDSIHTVTLWFSPCKWVFKSHLVRYTPLQ